MLNATRLQDEREAIAKDKFLVQMTPLPVQFNPAQLNESNMNQVHTDVWKAVGDKDRIDFKLRVIKRKDEGPSIPGGASLQPAAGAVARSEAELQEDLEKLKLELQALEQERMRANATLSQLAKLEDSKGFDANKKMATTPAVGSSTSAEGSSSAQSGFLFVHLIIVALISLIVGAAIQRQDLGPSRDL